MRIGNRRESSWTRAAIEVALTLAIAIPAVATTVYADRDFMEDTGGRPDEFDRPLWSSVAQPAWAGMLRFRAARVQTAVATFLGVASGGLALVMLGRRVVAGPRSGRGPGTVSVAVAASILGLRALEIDLVGVLYGLSHSSRYVHFYVFWVKLERDVSIAIAGAWAVLVLAGRWRARRDWWDRLGRWLGWAWIGVLAYRILSQPLWAWSNTTTEYPWF